MGFDQPVLFFEEGDLFVFLLVDGLEGGIDFGLRHHEVAGGGDHDVGEGFEGVTGEGVDAFDAVDFGAEEFEADGVVFGIGGEDVEGVAADAEAAGCGFVVISFVLDFNQFLKSGIAIDGVADVGEKNHLFVVFGGAEAVDAGDGGDDDDVFAVEQSVGGGEAEALDLGVDGGVFFDEGIGLGDVGFGLVVVVVGDEVFNGIVWEEGFQLGVELGRECFVVAEDECGAAVARDGVGHCEGFAGAGYAFKGLEFLFFFESVAEFFDGLGLVAGGLKLSINDERLIHN